MEMTFDRSLLERRDACPLCEAAAREPHLELDGFHIVRCAGCRFLYVVEVIPDAVGARYYADGYAGLRHRQGQEVNASINIEVLRSIGDLRGKSLLDIGSGFGFLLARARDELGMVVTGAELSKSERAFAAETLHVETVDGTDALAPGRRFDVVSMFEVVEHLRTPKEMIELAASLLNPGGYLVLGTDNFESEPVRAMGAGFPKWIPHQHISLFGPDSLRRLGVASHRFAVHSEASYSPWEYAARIAVQRLSRGRKGVRRFALDDELSTEDGRGFRFFRLRRALNALYVRFSRQRSLNGAMMHLVLRKV